MNTGSRSPGDPQAAATRNTTVPPALPGLPELDSLDHELRAPLGGVIGVLGLLRDAGLTPAQLALVRAAHDDAMRLHSTLRDLFDLSALEHGGDILRKAPFDLCACLAACQRALRAAGDARGIAVELAVDGLAHAMVIGDAPALQRVVENLAELLMAVPGCTRLQLRVELCDIGEDQRRLSLHLGAFAGDRHADGAAAAAATQTGSSSGARMALALRLLAAMEGQAGMERPSGALEGYWFKVDFPTAPSPLLGVRLLAIDGATEAGAQRARIFQAAGLRVERFNSVSAALDALTQAAHGSDPFRLALLDQQLGGVDGEATGRVIAGDPLYRATRLVLLDGPAGQTAGRTPPPPAQLAGAGFSAWLQAPVAPHQLLSTLARLAAAPAGHPLPFLGHVLPAPASLVHSAFASYRILAVDAHETSLQVLVQLLQGMGCQVSAARDGDSAVRLHASEGFDMVFLACQMPGVDGYSAAQRMRAADGPGRHTPMIGMSAAPLHDEAGMDDMLAKPLDAQAVREMLARWLPASANDCIAATQADLGEDYAELAALYCEDSHRRLQALKQAAGARDALAMAQAAHTLAGSSLSIGATGLSALLRELEAHCRTGALDGIEARLATICNEHARIVARLDRR